VQHATTAFQNTVAAKAYMQDEIDQQQQHRQHHHGYARGQFTVYFIRDVIVKIIIVQQ
jgi:predicted RNase H-like nuclease (RuvC/YqgF family)